MNQTPRFCFHCGAALNPAAQFCGACGHTVQPAVAPPLFSPPQTSQLGPVAQPHVSAPPLPPARVPPPKRRQKSCLTCLGCVVILSALAALAAGGLFLWQGLPGRSNNLALGKRVKVMSETITAAGGNLTIQGPDSPVDGLTITVPTGAYSDTVRFTISTRPIDGHQFGPDFNPITPLIHVDNGGEFAADAMTVEVPIQISPDEFAMAFYYDERTGALEGIPLLELTTEKATLLTSHFSDFVVSKVPFSELTDTNVDTGFVPGVDDWQFVNYGSYIAQSGHCAGQSLTAMWYYYEKWLGAGERRLYGRYDNNNHGYGTIDFQNDDSWGYRWASVVQRKQWDGDMGKGILRLWNTANDALAWYSLAYAMKLTGEPQYVSIGRYEEVQGAQERRGHALVAYRIEGNRLWVADPNYPGQADRYISFENGTFHPYSSGENAQDIAKNGVRVYPEIHYLAKTALVNWATISAEYSKLLDGKAGEGAFPPYGFSYLVEFNPATGDSTWKPLPEVLELDEADTARASEAYRGKLLVGINMTPNAFKVTEYAGTQAVEIKQSAGQNDVQFTIPLQVGVNDLGFGIENLTNNVAYYNDFRRVKVIYEQPDLSGTWEGIWRVEQAMNAIQYVEDGMVWFLTTSGLAESEAQAREIAAAAIEEDPNLNADRPLTIVLTAFDPDKLDRYKIEIHQVGDDGAAYDYWSEATFREGVLTFEAESPDGSKMHFTGTLVGKDTLSGEFNITAWVVVKDAVTGVWELSR